MILTIVLVCIFLTMFLESLWYRKRPQDNPWLYFIEIQIVMGIYARFFYAVVLIPMAAFGLWRTRESQQYPGRRVTAWRGGALLWPACNEEDGVVPPAWYLPGLPDRLRAWCWSAWRNAADNLKYFYRWPGSSNDDTKPLTRLPFYRKEFFGRWYVQWGWNSRGLPVCSGGAV